MYRYHNSGGQARSERDRAREEEELKFHAFPGRIILVDLAKLTGNTEEFEGRDWLENRLQHRLPLGWDIEWRPDRCKESDNPVALMQFASEDTALLIRTHITHRWLPTAVSKVLMSDWVKKIGCGYDGPDKQKMMNSFGFEPIGIVDVTKMAQKKGLGPLGLKSLADHFRLRMKKDSRQARSDWATREDLTQDQIQYAAEDAYFTYLIHAKLKELPDAADEEEVTVNRGVLELLDGWEEQGIARKHDGLWCDLCGKGPMTAPDVVAKHIQSKNHQKKLLARNAGATPADTPGDNVKAQPGEKTSEKDKKKADKYKTEIDELLDKIEEYQCQGIIIGDGNNPPLKLGESRCTLCDKGPFTAKQVLDAHLSGKEHKKKMGITEAVQPTQKGAPSTVGTVAGNAIARMMWNLPDYVTFDDQSCVAICTLCESKSSGIQQLQNHLGGDKHAKKCRTQGFDEIIYVPARKRLESMMTGKPLIRPGFRMPEEGEEPEMVQNQSNPQDNNRPGTAGYSKAKVAGSKVKENPLPNGYREYFDAVTQKHYYEEVATGRTQWERPTVAAAVAPLPPVPPPKEDVLPPGWKKVWDEKSQKHYYADIETQVAQWTPPEPYVQGGWERRLDPANRAFWEGGSIKFYENDDTGAWRRLVDEEDRTYWSNKDLGIRFFEPEN